MKIFQTDEAKAFVTNTPINYNIEASFAYYNNSDIAKIKYLLHQINYYHNKGGYQVHIKNHAWVLGLKDGAVTTILNKLVEDKIIYISSPASKGFKSNTYSMVKPYSITDSVKSYLAYDKHHFFKKLLADDFIVKGREHSAYLKNASTILPSKEALQARVKQLEDLLTANGISIPVEPIIAAKPKVEEVTQPVIVPMHVVQSDSVPEQNSEQVLQPEIEFNSGLQMLTDDLCLAPFEDGLSVSLANNNIYIENYFLMSGWVDKLSSTGKIELFTKLIKSDSGNINFMLRQDLKAKFYKRLDAFGCKIVSYKEVCAA